MMKQKFQFKKIKYYREKTQEKILLIILKDLTIEIKA